MLTIQKKAVKSMKKSFAVLTALLLLITALPALAQGGSLPLYEVYPASDDGNAWIEVPNEYEYWTVPMSYTFAYVMDPASFTMDRIGIFVKIPEGYEPQAGDEDMSGFAEDGRRVLGGMDETEASTVIERYTINDLPAVRVDMTGQGFEMIWVSDGGDMYFFMYPLADAEFAETMRGVAETFHLVDAKTPAASQIADYEYTADENGVTITKYVGEGSRVAIPAEIDGKPVVALGDKAFYECGVTWVSVPDSVKSIGAYCFSGCTLLQTLLLPEGLTELPAGMLESCFRLLSLDIPGSVTTIGESAFWGNFYLSELRLPASLETIEGFNFVMAEYLERFIVPEGNTAFRTLDDGAVLLSGDGTRFIHYCCWQERASYTVPEGVETIDAFAFNDWGTLTEVAVPEGVTAIEGAAFIHARGLEKLILPASAVELGRTTAQTGDQVTDGGVTVTVLGASDKSTPVNLGQFVEGTTAITGTATIIAPEGSAAQAHAEQFKLTFEAANTADEVLQE